MTQAATLAQMGNTNQTFRNRIQNGAMGIDQRNAGASGTGLVYTVDRWGYYGTQASKGTWQQNAGSVTPPAGFKNYLGFTTAASAYSVLSSDFFEFYQPIEGYNVGDLGFGASGASTITISFWVRSGGLASYPATFGGGITNNGNTRNYPFTYTINAANTWEQKTVTIAGDTTGTWLTTNGSGIILCFGLGAGSGYSGTANTWNGTTSAIFPTGATSVVGTANATFYITGVQLEAGTTATPFEYRQYGTELALCQRYYEKSYAQGTVPGTTTDVGRILTSSGSATTNYYAGFVSYKVTKRSNATPTIYAPSNGSSGQLSAYNFGVATTVVTPTIDNPCDTGFGFYFNGTSATGWGIHYATSAEL